MRENTDLALIGQDPRFGGGFRSMATVFWQAAAELGRRPHLYFLSRGHAIRLVPPQLVSPAPREELFHEPFAATAYPSTLPELDAFNQVVGALRIAPRLRRARTVFAVATTAPYALPALVSRRPYSLWLATGLESEWAARREGLSASRRAALALNRPLLRLIERAVIKRARGVYALSTFARETIAEGGRVTLDRVGLLPMPVDTTRYSPVSDAEWSSTLDAPVLVFTGRANDPRKNFGLLAEAFAEVRRRLPAARLRVIGEPPPLRHRTAGMELLGPMGRDDVIEPLRTSTLFVFASLQEGFGIAAAEALAAGLPAVVTPSGGPEELVRASGGGVVLNGFDVHELAEAIVSLLGDRERLLEMRRAGRAYVAREHSPERFRAALAEALAELDA